MCEPELVSRTQVNRAIEFANLVACRHDVSFGFAR
jgi:hypothetical protein